MTAQLDVFLPLPLTKRGPSYTCGMLVQGMAGPDLGVTVFTPRTRDFPVAPAAVVETLPFWAKHVPFRWIRLAAANSLNAAFVSQVARGQSKAHAAYIWPDATLNTINALRGAGIKIFREMINTHRGTAKGILDKAYGLAGLPPSHGITSESVVMEQQALGLADYIFCPNPTVEQSLLEHGVPASKILSASYGWEPDRFRGSNKLLEPCEGVTAVFVGTISIRKGSHLLLDYWARSKVRGRLVLAGAMESVVRETCASLLARDDVVVLDFTKDVGALYRSSDMFIFPTLEEGSPLVTYEACGCGVPMITTPMGSGGVVRHGHEGLVLDPYDDAAWISAIQELAEDNELRQRMSVAARDRAGSFHWPAVAHRRRGQVLDRLAKNSQPTPKR